MSKYQIGIRKYTERAKVRYWLIVSAKVKAPEEDDKIVRSKLTGRIWANAPLAFVDHPYWKFFILFTIVLNVFITVNFFSHAEIDHFLEIAVVVQLTCFFYWIDFLSSIAASVMNANSAGGDSNGKKISLLAVDAVSLVPLSTVYLLVEYDVNVTTFWWLRAITLLRFYRIPQFVSRFATVERNHWKVLVMAHTFYIVILIDVFANVWICLKYDSYGIDGWRDTALNEFIVSIYFSAVTVLNVGFGDISPQTHIQIAVCCLAMMVGFILTAGVITGTLATGFVNREKKREIYRGEYESTMSALKKSKFDKRIVDKISENLQILWSHRKNVARPTTAYILPVSLKKEIYFDVNFGFLNRSIIFSLQPRSFLRSVSLMMKNMSFLPGDVIIESLGMGEAMICVASGVIEILSEENDDTPIVSFTTGTILGEATLFISVPVKCIIRASTNVELQVLFKKNFSRLALKYTEIYRSMRAEILHRVEYVKKIDSLNAFTDLDPDVQEMTRRKATKYLQQELKKPKRERGETTYLDSFKTNLLDLYVLSENIPRVKTLPINLIKAKPWILRPNTTLTNLWDLFIVLVVAVVSYVYPCLAVFVRKVTPETYVMLFLVEVIYIVDLYLQCTTAIERNDHFTYITSIKQIIAHKLKTIGFYFDILATYDLTIFSEFVMPKDTEYALLLLSLNRILKFWRIPRYFVKLENNMSWNLLWLRTFKYFFFYSITVVWSSVIVYLEACPSESCIANRWYARLEAKEVEESDPTPFTKWPAIVSLYWGSVIVSGVGYGDLVPKSIPDCLAVLFCIILGNVIVIYCTAQASATLKHFQRYKTRYQEEVFGVDRFMTDHEISKELQNEVRNYFRMQWNYDKAFSLKHYQIIDGMPAQQKEIILTELMKKFCSVPVFKKSNASFLRLIAKSCKMRVLPPHEVITYDGSYVREMYILDNGYCEVSTSVNLRSLIGPLNSFGYFEMILGNPFNINVMTLTHARIISLDYISYLRAVTKYPNVKMEIETEIEKIYSSKEKSNPLDILGFSRLPNETKSNEEEMKKSILSGEFINVYRYHKRLSSNYWEPFEGWGKFRFFQFLLLPIVILPHSLFLKIWASLRIFAVLLIGFIVPIHFSLSNHTDILSVFVFILQGLSWLDIYLMFHVAYHDRRGLLIFHPAKTSTWYLKSTFALDLISTFPFYLVIEKLYPKSPNNPSFFHDASGFIIVLQFYKFFQGCHYLENDILRPMPHIKILKFIPLSIILTNIITGFVILLQCYATASDTKPLAPHHTLLQEFQSSISVFCKAKNSTQMDMTDLSPFRFYLIAYYWVTATMTTCGFGDVTAYDKTTMITVMIMIVLGLFLYGYMLASLTSTMISAYNFVMKYRRRIREMSRFMKLMNANNDIQRRLFLHYEYNWQRAVGGSPQKMFAYVHAALRENIVASMYEETIRQVPAFIDVQKSVIRVIGKYLDEMYFLRGETIVKYNDLLEYIYLIYRGKVEVRSSNGGYITTMGSGGLFGNISKKPFYLSSVAVVAAKNVDVLRLNTQIFFKTLQIFPNTKGLVDFLCSRTTDYIQPREYYNETSQEKETSSPQLDTLPYEITSMRMIRPTLHFSEIDLTSSKTHFFFNNSIFKSPGKKIYSFVFLHDSWLSNSIEIYVFLMAYLSTALTLYMFAFQDFSTFALILSYVLDAMFFVKIWYQFNLSYFDKYGNYVINKQNIKKRYFLEKKTLMSVDIVANLPLDFIALVLPKENRFLVLSMLRLNRILRLYYAYIIYDTNSKVLLVNKIYLKLSGILCNSVLVIHSFACIWYFITTPLGIKLDHTWVTVMQLNNASNIDLYIYSIYYIVTVITTTGYGDIKVCSSVEIITSIIFMIISRFGVAFLAGSMAAVINVHSLHLFKYQEIISNLRASLQHQNISGYQMIKMWKYVMSLWLRQNGKHIPKFIETAPYVMRCDVMNSMFGQHLSQSYIFSDMDETFLKQLAIHFRRFIYFPGNYIVQQGDIDHTMYFIHKGQVSVLTINSNLTETIHFKLEENDHFGMKQGLIIGTAHYFSYRADTEAEILLLSLSHWQHLLKCFPEVSQKIYQKLQTIPEQNEIALSSLTAFFS